MANHVERSVQVHLQHSVPLGLGHVEHHAVAQDARHVAQPVHATEVVYGGLHDPPGGLVLGHRVEVGDRRAAGVSDRLRRLLCRRVGGAGAVQRAAQVVHHDRRAVRRHPLGHLRADASTGAGNYHYSSFKPVAHFFYLVSMPVIPADAGTRGAAYQRGLIF